VAFQMLVIAVPRMVKVGEKCAPQVLAGRADMCSRERMPARSGAPNPEWHIYKLMNLACWYSLLCGDVPLSMMKWHEFCFRV
jgi:hypothetical protein